MKKVFVFLGLVFLLNSIFRATPFAWVLSLIFHTMPEAWGQALSQSQSARLALQLISVYFLPVVLSALFIWRFKIYSRMTANYGMTLITVTVILYLLRTALLYFSTKIPGGGATLAAAALLGTLNIPLKITLLLGIAKLLTTLEPEEESDAA